MSSLTGSSPMQQLPLADMARSLSQSACSNASASRQPTTVRERAKCDLGLSSRTHQGGACRLREHHCVDANLMHSNGRACMQRSPLSFRSVDVAPHQQKQPRAATGTHANGDEANERVPNFLVPTFPPRSVYLVALCLSRCLAATLRLSNECHVLGSLVTRDRKPAVL